MKRLHVNVAVENLPAAIRFYSTLFAAQPTVAKPDYAKWMLEDPRVNFAITARGGISGVDHLGIQVETEGELHEVYDRLKQAERPVTDQGDVTCCYAQSTKSWITDPAGIAWETFLTRGPSTVYGGDDVQDDARDDAQDDAGGEKAKGAPVADRDAQASACCGENPCGTSLPVGAAAAAKNSACCT